MSKNLLEEGVDSHYGRKKKTVGSLIPDQVFLLWLVSG